MGLLNLSYTYQEFPTRYLEGTVSLPASATRTKFSDFMLAMVHVGYGYVLEHISHSRGLQFVV